MFFNSNHYFLFNANVNITGRKEANALCHKKWVQSECNCMLQKYTREGVKFFLWVMYIFTSIKILNYFWQMFALLLMTL